MRREIGDKRGIAASLAGLGRLAVRSTANMDDGGSETRAAAGTHTLAQVEGGEQKEYDHDTIKHGAKLLGATEAVLESISAALDSGDRLPYERAITIAREQLGEEAFEAARRQGRAMSIEEGIAYALGGDE